MADIAAVKMNEINTLEFARQSVDIANERIVQSLVSGVSPGLITKVFGHIDRYTNENRLSRVEQNLSAQLIGDIHPSSEDEKNIITALSQRFFAVATISAHKKRNEIPVRDLAREGVIIEGAVRNAFQHAAHGQSVSETTIRQAFIEIIDFSARIQEEDRRNNGPLAALSSPQ